MRLRVGEGFHALPGTIYVSGEDVEVLPDGIQAISSRIASLILSSISGLKTEGRP